MLQVVLTLSIPVLRVSFIEAWPWLVAAATLAAHLVKGASGFTCGTGVLLKCKVAQHI